MADGYNRGRAFNTALLATIHAEQGELEQACSTGAQAVELTGGVQSRRATHRIVGLRRRLDPHATVPAVRGFLEQTRVVTSG